jgi:uncharacterized low-complexity protein
MFNNRLKPITVAIGTAFAASMAATSSADVQENPFGATDLGAGYDLLAKDEAEGKCGEGKCGEGKCGDAKGQGEGTCGEGKCGEGKCGEAKDEAKDGGEGKCGEGKCGEGKCGDAA